MKRRRHALEHDGGTEQPATACKNINDILSDPLEHFKALQVHEQQLRARATLLTTHTAKTNPRQAAHHQQQKQRSAASTGNSKVRRVLSEQPDRHQQYAAQSQHLLDCQQQLSRSTLEHQHVGVSPNKHMDAIAMVGMSLWVEPESPEAATVAAKAASTAQPGGALGSPSSSSGGYPIQHIEIDTVDLTLDTDTEGEDDQVAGGPAQQPVDILPCSSTAAVAVPVPAVVATGLDADTAKDSKTTETEEECDNSLSDVSMPSNIPALAVTAANISTLQSLITAAVTSSSSSDSSDDSDDSSSSSDDSDDAVCSDAEWTPSKPVLTGSSTRSSSRGGRDTGSCANLVKAAAAASPPPAATGGTAGDQAAAGPVQQLTPPNAVGAAKQQQQQQEETPVLTEQQRIRVAADCKSPGTPQILLLPCGLPGSSVLPAPAAAASQQQQQQVAEKDAGGRRVLAEVQLGQQRGLITPPNKTGSKLDKQQEQQRSRDSTQQFLGMGKPAVKSLTAAAAAPSTPEIMKHSQVTPQQQRDIMQCRDKQPATASPVTPKATAVADAGVCVGPASVQPSAIMCGALRAREAARAAAAAATAAASQADARTNSSSVSASPVAVAVMTAPQQPASDLLSPQKQRRPAEASHAGAAADTAAAPGMRRSSLPAPPLSDFRTISYVRTPRQPEQGWGRIAGTAKKAREAAAKAYHEAAAAAYSSGSNVDWNSHSNGPGVSHNSVVNAYVTSINPPSDGAGSLIVKPTLEQRVACAYLRMRLTEAAAAGASWAALDLAGMLLDSSKEALEACRQKYAAERGVLVKCRNPAQVAAEDKRMAAAFNWIKEVRLAAEAAAKTSSKQGVLRRPVHAASLPAWQVGGTATVKQSVRFSAEVQVSTTPAATQQA